MASDKFKAMVHLVVASCDDPHRLGATKLNKICWFSDTSFYRAFGVPISGERYVKRDHGPVPYSILTALRSLEGDGKILVRQSDHPIYKTKLIYSLEKPAKSLLSEEEIATIEAFTNDICRNYTANGISERSHDEIWAAAADGEELPFAATLVAKPGEITAEIEEWADSVLATLRANRRGESERVAAT